MTKRERTIKKKLKRAKKDIGKLKQYANAQDVINDLVAKRINGIEDTFDYNFKCVKEHKKAIFQSLEENYAILRSNEEKVKENKKQINTCVIWNCILCMGFIILSIITLYQVFK